MLFCPASASCIILVCAVPSQDLYRRISNWASPRTSALKPRLSVSSHNTDARQTIERLTLSSYSACVNTENLVIKPGSAQIDVNFVNLKFVYSPYSKVTTDHSLNTRRLVWKSNFWMDSIQSCQKLSLKMNGLNFNFLSRSLSSRAFVLKLDKASWKSSCSRWLKGRTWATQFWQLSDRPWQHTG